MIREGGKTFFDY